MSLNVAEAVDFLSLMSWFNVNLAQLLWNSNNKNDRTRICDFIIDIKLVFSKLGLHFIIVSVLSDINSYKSHISKMEKCNILENQTYRVNHLVISIYLNSKRKKIVFVIQKLINNNYETKTHILILIRYDFENDQKKML